jgi:hypothetical protein
MSSGLEKLLQQIEANGHAAAEVHPKEEPKLGAGKVGPTASDPREAPAEGEGSEPKPAGTIPGSSINYRKRTAFVVFLILILLLFSNSWR